MEGAGQSRWDTRMKAAVYTRYGPPDVVQIQDIEKPVPKDNEILIDIRAASVNPLDWHFMRGDVRLLTGVLAPKHKVLGAEIAGRVEGSWQARQAVSAGRRGVRGFVGKGMGGFAEYACSIEERLALKPAAISFEEAAGVTVAALTALQGLRGKGRIQSGQQVLVDGSSGGV